jgi:hypothetical protein
MPNLPSKIARVIENGYSFLFGSYISRGFEILNRNVGLFIGYFLVYILISVCMQVIPIIGPLAGLIIGPPLAAGIFIVANKVATGEYAQFNDFFKGFEKLGNLFLAGLLVGLIIFAAMIPGLIVAGTSFYGLIIGNITPEEIFTSSTFWLGILLMALPAMYLGISYVYAPMLVWFYNMDVWPAMEASRKIVAKNWFSHLGFLFVLGIISMAGFLLLGIGILYTVPAIKCALYAAFADITGLEEDDASASDDMIDHFVPSGQ